MKRIELNDLLFSKAAELPYLKLMETMVAQRPQISSQNKMWSVIFLVLLWGC